MLEFLMGNFSNRMIHKVADIVCHSWIGTALLRLESDQIIQLASEEKSRSFHTMRSRWHLTYRGSHGTAPYGSSINHVHTVKLFHVCFPGQGYISVS